MSLLPRPAVFFALMLDAVLRTLLARLFIRAPQDLEVTIDVSVWCLVYHGEPAGDQIWEFQLGGLGGHAFSFKGDYSMASVAARRFAQSRGETSVFLCP